MEGIRLVDAHWSRGRRPGAADACGGEAGTYDVVSCNAPGADGQEQQPRVRAGQLRPAVRRRRSAAGTRPTRAAPTGSSRARAPSTARSRNGSPSGSLDLRRPGGHARSSAITTGALRRQRDSGGDDPNTPFATKATTGAPRSWTDDQPADRRRRPAGRPAGTASASTRARIGAPGGTQVGPPAPDNRLALGASAASARSSAAARRPTAATRSRAMVVYGTQVTLQDNERADRLARAARCISAGLAQAVRRDHLLRLGQHRDPLGDAARGPADRDRHAVLRLHVQGALRRTPAADGFSSPRRCPTANTPSV